MTASSNSDNSDVWLVCHSVLSDVVLVLSFGPRCQLKRHKRRPKLTSQPAPSKALWPLCLLLSQRLLPRKLSPLSLPLLQSRRLQRPLWLPSLWPRRQLLLLLPPLQ
jgi:hypothetical protein